MELAKYDVIIQLITEAKKEGLKQARKETSGLEKQFGVAKRAFAGIFAANVVKNAIGDIFSITKRYEQYSKVLKVALGSQKASDAAMRQIRNTASQTIFSIDELTSSYIKFANRGIKLTSEEIIKLADLAASQGKSFDQLTEAVLDAQTGEFERLKEFGIRASKSGDQVTLAFKGVNKTVQNTPQAIQKALLGFGELDGVLGSNAEQMSGLAGQTSNLFDTIDQIGSAIGDRLRPAFNAVLRLSRNLANSFLDILTPTEKLTEETRTLQTEFNTQIGILKRLNPESKDRAGLIEEINTKYKDYLPNLLSEKSSIEEIEKAQRAANKAFEEKIIFIAFEEALREEIKKTTDAVKGLAEAQEGSISQSTAAQQIDDLIQAGLSPASARQLEEFNKQTFKNLGDAAQEIVDTQKSRITQLEESYNSAAIGIGSTLDAIRKRFGNKQEAKDTGTQVVQAVAEGVKEQSKTYLQQLEQLIEETKTQLRGAAATSDFLGVAEQLKNLEELQTKLRALQEFLNPTRQTGGAIDLLPILDSEVTTKLDSTIIKIKALKEEINLTQDPEVKEELEKQLDELLELYKKFFGDIDKLRDESVNKKPSTLTKFFDELIKDIQKVNNAVQGAASSITELTDIQRNRNDEEISRQEERVSSAESLAERGNSKLLEIEQNRLDELLVKRQQFEQRQRVIDNASIIAANAVAAAESIKTIAKSFSAGGPIGIATGIATSLALAAQIGIITSTVNDSFGAIPGFFLGSELIGSDPRFRANKVTNGKDGYVFRGDGTERMVDGATNAQLNGFPNALLPAAVKAYQEPPRVNLSKVNLNQYPSNQKIEKKLDSLKESIEAIDINLKLDAEGFAATIQQKFDNVIRRKRYMS